MRSVKSPVRLSCKPKATAYYLSKPVPVLVKRERKIFLPSNEECYYDDRSALN